MAPSTDISVLTIFPWPHFQAVLDGLPLIGGKLYSFAANTSTPKSTKADPFGLVDNPNPLILNDQGAAEAWLNDFYNLRLYTPDDVLVWAVDNYKWEQVAPAPSPGDKIMGSTDADVVSTPGAWVISVPGLVPVGYRCEGVVWTITSSFGTSGGMTEMLIGDQIANDRWSKITNLAAGQTGGQVNFHSDTVPIEPIPYVILVSAINGNYDSSGGLHITAFWSTLPADVP